MAVGRKKFKVNRVESFMQDLWFYSNMNVYVNRLFLLGNCCLFFNNIDQSITFFIRASFCLDRLLTKFMGLEQQQQQQQMRRETMSNRRSIIINKRATNIRESLGGDIIFSIDSENQLLLDYYTRCIHYYDLNGNVEAAIELIQTGTLY